MSFDNVDMMASEMLLKKKEGTGGNFAMSTGQRGRKKSVNSVSMN